MGEYLYRYISFEAFVGMIQEKSLTFVLPELWDDPKEGSAFKHLISSMEHNYKQVIFSTMYYKTYAQCWTMLSESDAMWRIYSFNNRAVQIKVSKEKLKALPDVKMIPVEYSDQFDVDTTNLTEIEDIYNAFLQSLAMKRCAFEHEKEVRLIRPYIFQDDDDIKKHYDAFRALVGVFNEEDNQGIEILESMYPGQSPKDKAENVMKLLNLGSDKQNTLDIPFDNISGFIAGVKVHPLSPDWYASIVKEYCTRNNLPFDGRSTLYSKADE
ncbi:MAG: DUF2971 domain-containing protein [Clostridia bacterium]|nr:DUF2971 domain-containing protein [Clostridia bacterium]